MIRRIMHTCILSVLFVALFGPSPVLAELAFAPSDASTLPGEERCDALFSEGKQESSLAYAGKPISLVSGAETFSRTDLTIGSLYPISIERHFNSQSTYDSPVGYGWALNYDRRLYTYADDSVTLRQDCGGKRRFNKVAGGYVSTTNKGTLFQNADGTFTYTDASGYQDVYDIRGRLVSLVDPRGNSQVITYKDAYRHPLTGVLPTNLDLWSAIIVAYDYRMETIQEKGANEVDGASVTFSYNNDGRLESLLDSAQRSIIYGHDTFGNLTDVTGNNLNHIYTYGDQYSRHHLMTVNEGQGLYTNAYNAEGWITRQAHGALAENAGVIDIEYLVPGQKTKVTTTVKNSAGVTLSTQSRITEFDSAKRIAVNTDAYGNVKNYIRDPLTSVVTREEQWENTGSPENPNLVLKAATDFTYDSYGNMKSKTEASKLGPSDWDAIKRTTLYDYVYEFYPSATSATYHKLAKETVQSVVNPALVSTITNSYYPETGNLKFREETGYLGDGTPYTYTTGYTYYPNGKPWTVDGPRTDVSDVTTYEYTAQGYLWKVTQPLIGTTTYTDHDDLGNPRIVTDPYNNSTIYTYDTNGRVSTVKTPGDANSTQYFYISGSCGSSCGGSGKIDYIILPEGNLIDYSYDSMGNLSTIADSQNNSINYTYDSEGNKLAEQIKDSSGSLQKSLGYSYDALNRLKRITNPDNSYTEYDYYGSGNRKSAKDPNTNTTAYEYDALSRLKTVTQPTVSPAASIITTYGYNSNNNLTSVKDANNNTTTYVYDDKGRVYQVISPDTGTTTYTYDPAGNLKTKSDAKGITISYTYDALNRLTGITSPSVEGLSAYSIIYTYDDCLNGKGRLCSMTDTSGSTTYEYWPKGQVKKETKTIEGHTYVTQYSYDQNGNVKTMTYPSGKVITYNYLNDRAISVLNGAANLATNINYKPFGGMSSITYGNSLNGSIIYDNQYRITGISAAGVMGLNYPAYDYNGNIQSIQDQLDSTKNKGFTYDALDRLSTANSAGIWGSLGWTYDGVGNRQAENGNAYTYSTNSNKLNTANGLSYGFDNNGNTAAEGARAFTYNQNQRLIRVTDSGVTKGEYTYNGNGQRVKKITAEGTTIFHYSLNGQIIAESDAAGTITAEYVYLNGQPLAKMEGTNSYYYHNDHLGTPQKMTDGAGVVTWSADYKPFGETTITVSTITNNLRFPGQYFDAETGNHYNYFRDYNPEIGKYMESDPLYSGVVRIIGYAPLFRVRLLSQAKQVDNNLYIYANNNAIRYKDIFGLESSDDFCSDYSRYKMCNKLPFCKKFICKLSVDNSCSGPKNSVCCDAEFDGCMLCANNDKNKELMCEATLGQCKVGVGPTK